MFRPGLSRCWLLLGMVLALLGSAALAQPSLEAQVRAFLAQQPDLQGRELGLKWPVQANKWPACTEPLQLSLAGRKAPVGWVTVVLRCATPGWQRTLQLRVQTSQKYLAAARNLMPGQVLSADDLVWAEGDSAQLGTGTVQDLAATVGQELRRPLTQGSPLRLNILQPVTVIKKGSQVSLIIRGAGFDIETAGQAMDNAPIGGPVRVLVREGAIVPAQATAAGVAVAQ